MISERRIEDILDGLSALDRTTDWSSAPFDPGALSHQGSFAWIPSEPTNVTFRVGSRLMIIRAGQNSFLPTWVKPTIASILPTLKLELNWDFAGGRPIAPEVIGSAMTVLSTIMEYNSPAPSVVPTSIGGIQFEWHARGIDLEISVPPRGEPTFEFETLHGDAVEGRLPENIGLLANLISRLSRP